MTPVEWFLVALSVFLVVAMCRAIDDARKDRADSVTVGTSGKSGTLTLSDRRTTLGRLVWVLGATVYISVLPVGVATIVLEWDRHGFWWHLRFVVVMLVVIVNGRPIFLRRADRDHGKPSRGRLR